MDWCGILFRKTNPGDTYATSGYLVILRVNGSLELWKNTQLQAVATGLAPGPWVHIKVIAQGTSIKIYANNVLTITATDVSFSSGYFSVMCQDSLGIWVADLLVQGINNEFTTFLSESKDSLAATGLGTFSLKLAGRPSDIQGLNVASWPLFAVSDRVASGTLISGSYLNTQVQDNSFVDIAPPGGNGFLDYRLRFNANTLHNPTQFIVTVWAKRGALGGNAVHMYVFTGLSISPTSGDLQILGTTNTKYVATFNLVGISQPIIALDGTVELQFASDFAGVTSDLLIDFVQLDFYRQGEFLGQEIYICHNGRPTFGGITEDATPAFSELGYVTDLSGVDFGWPLPKRLFTQDYPAPVSLDQITRDILNNTGSGLTYAGGLNIGGSMQQNFENENALQLLLKIANFAQFDYRVDFSKVLVFRPRGLTGPTSFSSPPTEAVNIRSLKAPHSLKDMRNEIIIYFNSPAFNPSDGDAWTTAAAVSGGIFQASGTIAGLTVTAITTVPPGPKVGADYIDMKWTNPPNTTFMQCYIFLNAAGVAPFNLRAWETLNFWYAASVTGTSFIAFTVTLMKIATLQGWSRTFNVAGVPVNTWIQIGGDTGVQVPTVASSRGWAPQNNPVNNNIDTIMFSWFIQTGTGDIYIDGFSFNRAYSILQLDDMGSQNTYGLRGAYTYDKTRTDLTSANLLGTGELAVKKFPSRKTEITILGDETMQPAENIFINSSSLNIGQQLGPQQEFYSIREVTHQWSKNGYLTDLKLTDMLIAGVDVEDMTKILKDEVLFTDRAAKGGTGGITR